MSQRIVISGGTGFIGKALIENLSKADYECIVLSRNPERKINVNSEVVKWDARRGEGWSQYADGALAIINLAGDNIGTGRWTKNKKRLIIESRTAAANAVIDALKRVKNKPSVVIQPSGVGYYGNRGSEILNESSVAGTGYMVEVAQKWEQSIKEVEAMGIRLATIRIGVVLGKGGGFLSRVQLPFRFFIGGHLGSGAQWISWVHINDVVKAIRFLIDNEQLHGIFNVCAPNPFMAKDFFKIVGKVMNRPSWFPVPGFLLKLLFGEMADELILSGQRVLPQRLLDSGYSFQYADLEGALRDILG